MNSNRRAIATVFAVLITAPLALSACGGPPRLWNDGTRPGTPSATGKSSYRPSGGAGLQAVATATPGDVQTVDDPALGGAVEISVIRDYAAASGRQCKRILIRRVTDGGQDSRVACLGADGWYWSAVTAS